MRVRRRMLWNGVAFASVVVSWAPCAVPSISQSGFIDDDMASDFIVPRPFLLKIRSFQVGLTKSCR